MNEIIKLLQIKEKCLARDKYHLKARDVAKYHRVSLNAVYTSRRLKTDKLDKLMSFDKLQKILTVADVKKLKGKR